MNELTKKFRERLKDLFPNTQIYKLYDLGKNWWAYPISEENIKDENSLNKKNWIFFTPNWDFATKSGKRVSSNAENLYCAFLDRDDKVKFWENAPLPPTIVVETKNWYHAYWLFKNPVKIRDWWEQWKEIQQMLTNFCWGDGLKDYTRIMRLPWTKYWKDNKGEFVVEVKQFNEDNLYDFNDFIALLNAKEIKETKEKKIKKEAGSSWALLIDEIDRTVNVEDVLHDLGWWVWEVRWTVIYEWWEQTRGYKKHPTQNYINNWSNENTSYTRPIWWPFAVAKQLFWDIKEAFDYFKKQYNIWEEVKPPKKSEVVKEEWDNRVIYETPRGNVIFDYNDEITYFETKETSKILLDWIIEPVGFYVDEDNIRNYIVRYYKQSEIAVSVIKELWKWNKFEEWLSRFWMTFFGTGKDKSDLISYIQSVNNEYSLITAGWIRWSDLIISERGQYILERWDKKYFVDIPRTKNSKSNSDEDDKLIHYNSEDDVDIRQVVKDIGKYYKKEIIYSLFCAFGCWLMSYQIRNSEKSLPIVSLVGSTQSGKTTLRSLMQKMYGVDNSLELQAASTHFPVMQASKHYLPVIVAEFQNEWQKFDWNIFLKNIYDNSPDARGTAAQNVKYYELNAMICMDWEKSSLDNAVYTRSITLFCNPNYKAAYLSLDKELPNVVSYFLNNYERIYKISYLKKKYINKLTERTADLNMHEKDRIINNYALLLAFAECFDFVDIVEEYVVNQMFTQFNMMWDSSIDDALKQVMSVATIRGMWWALYVDESYRIIVKIEFLTDILSFKKETMDDLKSSIKTINHHFWWEKEETIDSDKLYIPFEYIKNTKKLHTLFNRFANLLAKNAEYISDWAKNELKNFAEHNNYTNTYYYKYVAEPLHYDEI